MKVSESNPSRPPSPFNSFRLRLQAELAERCAGNALNYRMVDTLVQLFVEVDDVEAATQKATEQGGYIAPRSIFCSRLRAHEGPVGPRGSRKPDPPAACTPGQENRSGDPEEWRKRRG